MNPLDYYFWSRLKDWVNQSNPTTIEEVKSRIQLYMDTQYNQAEMAKAILGHFENGKMTGGLPSRLRATWSHGGRSMNCVTRAERHAAPPVPLCGPMNKPF